MLSILELTPSFKKMEWPASLRQTCRTEARPRQLSGNGKVDASDADERFLFSSGEVVPSALIGKEMEIL